MRSTNSTLTHHFDKNPNGILHIVHTFFRSRPGGPVAEREVKRSIIASANGLRNGCDDLAQATATALAQLREGNLFIQSCQ